MITPLCSVFGDWLSEFEWDFFGTFTFSMPRKSDGISPVVRWWGRHAANSPSVSGRGFFAEEFGRDGDRLHVHALLHSDPTQWQERLFGKWRKYWGRERILKFDKSKGAGYYCAKYLMKTEQERAEWRFVEWEEGVISDGSDIGIITPSCPEW